jgi:quercetin dioxygenase-like cupin family protein
MMMSPELQFRDLPWSSFAAGAREKVFEFDGKRIRLVEFSKGFIEPDWCEKSHVGYVCLGKLELDFVGEILRLRTGDGIFISAGEKHKAAPASDRVLLFLVEEI